MSSHTPAAEVENLELKLKEITERFDRAIVDDIVLKEAKEIYHELKKISERLSILKLQGFMDKNLRKA